MTDLPPPPPSRDLPPGVHLALRDRVIAGTYEEAPSRRRWLLPVAAAAAVFVVVFGAIGFLRGGSSSDPAPAASDPATTPAPAPATSGPPPVNPTTFDPLYRRITPGWMPDDFPLRSRYSGRAGESLSAGHVEGRLIGISVDPRDSKALKMTGDTVVPGPDVNGKPSTWSELNGVKRGWLTWEWADGAEAMVQLWGFPHDPEGNAATAARIAENLRPQSPTRVALPFTVEGPAYAWVLDTHVDLYGENYITSVRFGPTAGVVRDTTIQWKPDVFVQDSFPPNARAGARDVNVRVIEGAVVVREVFDRNVAETTCRPKAGGPGTAEMRAECLEIAATVSPHGDVKAPTSWATDPVR